MKKKLITSLYVVSGCALLYIGACVADIVAHNATDYEYANWNVINNCFAEEELSTEEIYEELTTEATTVQFINPESTDIVEIEIGDKLTTEEITETTYYVAKSVSTDYSYDEVEMLAHLINGEAGADWCSDTTRYYVGSVVLNRVNSYEFPDTIYGVIFQSGQYACTWDGNYDRTPSQRCYEIAKDLLENGSWLPNNVVFQANFSQGSGVYDYIDGVYFCYR